MRTRVTAVLVGLVLVMGAAACEPLPPWWPTVRATPEEQQRAFKRPIVADLDDDGLDDIFWYAPNDAGGDTTEELWSARADGGFDKGPAPAVYGRYRPIVLDLTGDGGDDILWYASQGTSTAWIFTDGVLVSRTTMQLPQATWIEVIPNDGGTDDVVLAGPFVDGTPLWWDTDGSDLARPVFHVGYDGALRALPVAGDFDGDGRGDVLLNGAGADPDVIWWSRADGTMDSTPITDIRGWYQPVVLDADGDGRDDIGFFGYRATSAPLWLGRTGRWFARSTQPVPTDYCVCHVQHSLVDGGRDTLVLTDEEDLGAEVWNLGADGVATARPIDSLLGREVLLGRFSAGGLREDAYLYSPVGRDSLLLSPRAA